MKALIVAVITALLLFGGSYYNDVGAIVDLRGYIDSGRVYSNVDSLEFIGGVAHYDGYSDTVRIHGAELISADFIFTRNGPANDETVGNCYIRLEGSKDGVNFVNTDTANDSIHVTTVNTTTTITFPYASIYSYFRMVVHSDTLFSAMVKWKVGGQTNVP